MGVVKTNGCFLSNVTIRIDGMMTPAVVSIGNWDTTRQLVN